MPRIEKRSPQEFFHFKADDIQRLGIHQVGLGQDGDSIPDMQQPANVEVLAGLRLDRRVGGNHQQHQINPTHSRQHVADEALVAGNIDESQPQRRAVSRGQVKIREAEVNRDPPTLLLRQAVRVDAG